MISLGLSRASYTSSTDEIVFVLASLAAAVAIAITIFLCFAYADRVQLLLGPGGTDIAVRLSEFILFCLGIQILWSGGSELLKSVLACRLLRLAETPCSRRRMSSFWLPVAPIPT